MRRRAARVGWVLALVLTPALAVPHAFLVKSIPARRAVLVRAPERVQLWFNERLEPQFSRVSVWDAGGRQMDLADVQAGPDDPKRLSVGIPPLAAGTYVVKFRVLSVDGHVVEDQFPFTLRKP
ncbi:MAG: copper resistance CopC family protein [Actinomycetota bacterium]